MNKTHTVASAIIFLIILVLTTSAPAHAQMGLYGGATPKSESVAVQQSIMNTAFPLVAGYGMVALFDNSTVETVGATMVVYGIVSGPSSGNFYGTDYLRGGLGVLSRIGLVLAFQDATSELFGREFADALNVDDKKVSFGDTGFIVRSSLLVGTMIYNIASAPVSVREYNRSIGYVVGMETLRGRKEAIPVLTARFYL